MKEVLARIAKRQQDFATLPLFQFLRDSSVHPRQRLAFAPCFAPFVMGFGELNRLVFREDDTTDPIQLMINQHTREDDSHWIWFLEDLQKLELDASMGFSQALRYLWGNETQASRHMIYELYRYSYQAPPLQKLVIIEAIEATADIFLAATAQVAQDLQAVTGKECRYFGDLHFAIDSGHSLHLAETEELIAGLQLSEVEQDHAFELVDRVFTLFTDFFNLLLVRARSRAIALPQSTVTPLSDYAHSPRSTAKPMQSVVPKHAASELSGKLSGKRLGAYLVEAGLLTAEQLEQALMAQARTEQRLGEVLSAQGWVNQQTIEYLMEKVVLPERDLAPDRSLSLAS